MEARSEPVLPPGFRFHPTDEELIVCYLIKKVEKNNFSVRAIGDVDLNKSEPWELPEKAKMGEKEWYFFTLRDRKYPTGMRTNRATEAGYWKATGKDRDITRSGSTALVGAKKTLVFYRGRAPKGVKTNWIMHEYRLEGDAAYLHNCRTSKESEWVVCRIFQKSPGGKKAMYRDSNGGRTKSSFCDDVDTHSSLPPLLESPPFTGNDDSGAEAAESTLRGSSDHQINSFPMFHEKQPFSSLTQQLAGWSSGIVRAESSNMATNMNSPQAVLDAGNAFRFPALSCYDSYYDMSGASNALMAKLRQDLEIPTTRPGTAGGNAARSCKMEPPSYMDQQQPFPSNYSSGHGSLDNWVNESLGFEQQTTTTNNNSSSSFSESGLREILDSSNSSGLYRTGSSVDLEESFWPY